MESEVADIYTSVGECRESGDSNEMTHEVV